jgi:16S rRNA (cytidine1402-2'-O)-methyltransferase
MEPKLYIVGTPIGNMEDITLRALRVLREADVVLAEDTRVAKKLLAHYDIPTPTLSYHEHSGEEKYEKIFALLDEGKRLALVSDAGMPAISDPGARLVAAVREHYGDAAIEVVPGASAVTTALARAGVRGDTFTFLGFPPHKKGRKTFFETVAATGGVVVFYESPHRATKALASLMEVCDASRRVHACRELTKIHESVISGTPEEVAAHFATHPEEVRGEWVVVVEN